MDPRAREVFTKLVQDCLDHTEGQFLIEKAKSKLLDDLEGNKFNRQSAVEAFQIVIEKAVWKVMGATGVITVRGIRGDGILEEFARAYTEDFIRFTGAEDQRPIRRGLLGKLLGK